VFVTICSVCHNINIIICVISPRHHEVVVTRSDDKGYGLTVSGESPVVVQDVKDGEWILLVNLFLRIGS